MDKNEIYFSFKVGTNVKDATARLLEGDDAKLLVNVIEKLQESFEKNNIEAIGEDIDCIEIVHNRVGSVEQTTYSFRMREKDAYEKTEERKKEISEEKNSKHNIEITPLERIEILEKRINNLCSIIEEKLDTISKFNSLANRIERVEDDQYRNHRKTERLENRLDDSLKFQDGYFHGIDNRFKDLDETIKSIYNRIGKLEDIGLEISECDACEEDTF